MTPETRKLVVDRYTSWAEAWGISLAFAVTQSVEKAERIVADALVALITSISEDESTRVKGKPSALMGVSAQKFAAVVWEMSNAQAYRGFGADPFFRMPAISRAIVVLKTRAQFSRVRIAGIVRVPVEQVDGHLENARLLFSDGRPWLEASVGVQVHGDRWVAECPQWRSSAPRSDEQGLKIQDIFAQYIGNDLDTETGNKLHSHLVVCTSCRSSFGYFKKQYSDWASSVPVIEPATEMKKHLSKITNMALKVRRPTVGDAPSPWPGLKRLMRDGQLRAMLLGALIFMVIQVVLQKHHVQASAIRKMIRSFF